MARFLTFLLSLTCVSVLHAQLATTTALVGTVSDSSGKVIAGAKVTAVNSATPDTYNATTNEDGNYRIDFVRVGTCNITVEFAGFSRQQRTGSIVSINQTVRNDFTLSPGSVQELTIERACSATQTQLLPIVTRPQ